MATTEALERLEDWLNLYSQSYCLRSTENRDVTTVEAVRQLAETCDDIEIEGHRAVLMWTGQPKPSRMRYESIIALPEPPNSKIQLAPQPLTFEDYADRCPEKLELVDGYLGSDIEDALNLLDMSLETFGLLEVVRRAPKELWEEALNQVYGNGS